MFNLKPENMIQPDELIVYLVREYSIAKLPQIVLICATYFGLWFVMSWLFGLGWLGVVLFTVCLVSIMFLAVRGLITWRLDMLIITNQRLIDVDQTGLFKKVVQEISYDRIVDVKFAQRGVREAIFKYGSVIIDTQHLDEPIILQHVYKPNDIRDIIWAQVQNYGEEKRKAEN